MSGSASSRCLEGRRGAAARLAAEAVERAALALERVHDVERRDRLAARVLRVRHRIADDVLEEDLEDAARLLVDEAADALDTATASEAADGGLLQREKTAREKRRMRWRGSMRAQAGARARRARRSTLASAPGARAICRGALTVMPWMLSRRTLRWRFAPPLPRPFPPLPRPDILSMCMN